MILPNVRTSFGRGEAGIVVRLLAGNDAGAMERVQDRLREEGLDSLLDDPRTLNAALTASHDAPASLVFYLLVRHALLESGIQDRTLADYLTALVLAFSREDRAFRPDPARPDRFMYLVDVVAAMDTPDGRRQFLLRAHLGNYALWLGGIFPDHVTARVHRRGAPGLAYLEEMGATGYRMAADTPLASRHDLDRLFRLAADTFPALRIALNRVSDRYFFPTSRGSMDRLLRQISDTFEP
jgi:hypothetical protein